MVLSDVLYQARVQIIRNVSTHIPTQYLSFSCDAKHIFKTFADNKHLDIMKSNVANSAMFNCATE